MKRFLVVVKRTKWERDLIRYGSAETARKVYALQNDAYDRVFASHDRQKANLEALQAALPARYINRSELPFVAHSEYDFLVSFGGDNHFVYVSHFADHKPLLGLNSDPATSTGALLYFAPDDFLAAAQKLQQGAAPRIEEWTRVEGTLDYPDGRRLRTGPCTSEITVRSQFHDYISRYLIVVGGQGELEEQKCSGLLIATGAGSTGWYRNCQTRPDADYSFPKDAPFFRAIVREPGMRARTSYRYLNPEVSEKEELRVISEMDGEITVDANPDRTFDFPPGCVAAFRLTKDRLHIVHSV